jgi:folate-binding protein YgfZ
VVAPREKLSALVEHAALLSAAASVASENEAWTTLRVSAGFPVFGVDYTAEDNPHEASLDRRAVSFQKGCYLGQEVVYMQDARGKVKRRVVLLSIDSAEPVPSGTPLVQEKTGASVGKVTSAIRDGARTLALAKVQAPFYEQSADLRLLGHSVEFVLPPV